MIPNTYSADVIRRYLRSGAVARAEKLIDKLTPANLTPLVRDLTPLEARGLFDILFHPSRVDHALKALDRDDLGQILLQIDDDRLVAVLVRLSGAGQARLMGLLPPERRKLARSALQERANVFARGVRPVSSIMQPASVTLVSTMRVVQARERLEASSSTADPLFVVDGADLLCGVIRRSSLLDARPEEQVVNLMEPARAVTSTLPVREAVETRDLSGLERLAVIDEAGRLIGQADVTKLLELVDDGCRSLKRGRAGLSGWRKVLPWLTASVVLAASASWAWGIIHF